MPTNNLKQFEVSAYNQTLDKAIFHDQLVDARDTTDALRKAKDVHKSKFKNIPVETVVKFSVQEVIL